LSFFRRNAKSELLTLLGPYADETTANQIAAQTASDEMYLTQGQDQFFAYYNRGTSLVWLQDYANAAQVYDEAFRKYAELPAENRPWRVTWYMTGPYFAYYYTGRYYDVIALADKTINSASEPYIEENWYWRARAKAALGDTSGAIDDLRRSLQYHPGFSPSVQFLAQLGVSE
jgi:tetratricopeptide (TPR) repeat protein